MAGRMLSALLLLLLPLVPADQQQGSCTSAFHCWEAKSVVVSGKKLLTVRASGNGIRTLTRDLWGVQY